MSRAQAQRKSGLLGIANEGLRLAARQLGGPGKLVGEFDALNVVCHDEDLCAVRWLYPKRGPDQLPGHNRGTTILAIGRCWPLSLYIGRNACGTKVSRTFDRGRYWPVRTAFYPRSGLERSDFVQ